VPAQVYLLTLQFNTGKISSSMEKSRRFGAATWAIA
jgi:hypothetical protein